MSLTVAALGSGSRGNCCYVGDTSSGILVDAGLPWSTVRARLAACGLRGVRLDAVLVTHGHGDHCGAADSIRAGYHLATGRILPVYLSAGTAEETGIEGEVFRSGEVLPLPSGDVLAFPSYHDTLEPVGFYLLRQGVFYLTDSGHVGRSALSALRLARVAVLEFNHDPDQLVRSSYPPDRRNRIASRLGHLSNDRAREALQEAAPRRLEVLFQAHISGAANTQQLVTQAGVGPWRSILCRQSEAVCMHI